MKARYFFRHRPNATVTRTAIASADYPFVGLAISIVLLMVSLAQQHEAYAQTKERGKQKGNSSGTQFSEHLIADKYAYAYGIAAADLDCDGDLDLTSADYQPHNRLYLFVNDSRGNFHRHIIQKDDPERLERHMIGDVDDDGDLDVVMALGFYFKPDSDDLYASRKREDNQIVWYENDGTPMAGPWKKHIIQTHFEDAFEATAGDLDGDGDIDVAATSWRNPGRVAWFENHGDATGNWTQHLLKENWRSANQVIIADLNGDGRLDIAACAEHGSYEFRWWRNEGSQ